MTLKHFYAKLRVLVLILLVFLAAATIVQIVKHL
jgi:hypothetical protein